MLKPTELEVPSLELGPPSPSWTDLLVESPPGRMKPARRQRPASVRCERTWLDLAPDSPSEHEPPHGSPERSRARQRGAPSRRAPSGWPTSTARGDLKRPVRKTATSSTASSKPASVRRETNSTASSKPASDRRETSPRAEFWTAGSDQIGIADLDVPRALRSPRPCDMRQCTADTMAWDMEGDATEEFMREIWGDLMDDLPSMTNDNLLDAARPLDDLSPLALAPLELAPLALAPLALSPAADRMAPDLDQLMEGITDDQLLQLGTSLDLDETEVTGATPPAAVLPEASGSTIDLGALLEQTEILFAEPAEAPPAVTAPAPAASPASSTLSWTAASSAASSVSGVEPTAAPTHYVLVLPAAAAGSCATDDTDDSADEPDAPAPKRRRALSSDATPAEKYRRIRDNNNVASRRSRMQRKRREQTRGERAQDLEADNEVLRGRVHVLEGLLERVKALTPLLTARAQ